MIDAVGERRPNSRFGTGGTVRTPATGDGGVVAVGTDAGTVLTENFVVVVVMNIERDLVEVFLEIGNGAPHDSKSQTYPPKIAVTNENEFIKMQLNFSSSSFMDLGEMRERLNL